MASSVTLRVLLALSLAALGGCDRSPPVEFRQGQAISFGSNNLQVYGVQLDRLGETLVVSVNVRIDPTGEERRLDKTWIAYFNRTQLRDAAGKSHRTLGASPVEALRLRDSVAPGDAGQFVQAVQDYSRQVEDMSQSDYLPPAWNRWNMAFQVPDAGRPFSLYLRNPDPMDGQPRAVVVPVAY